MDSGALAEDYGLPKEHSAASKWFGRTALARRGTHRAYRRELPQLREIICGGFRLCRSVLPCPMHGPKRQLP